MKKKFHVEIMFQSASGPIVKTYTLCVVSPLDLEVQVNFLRLYDCKIGEEAIAAMMVEIKDTVDVDLVLAN